MVRLAVTFLLVALLVAPGLGAGSADAEAVLPSASLATTGSSGPTKALPSSPTPLPQPDELVFQFEGNTPVEGSAHKSGSVEIDPQIDNQDPPNIKVRYQLSWVNTAGETFLGNEYTCVNAEDSPWRDCTDWKINLNLDEGKYRIYIRLYSPDNTIFLNKEISRGWTIDSTKPVIGFDSSVPEAPNYVAQSPASITFTPNDNIVNVLNVPGTGIAPGSGFGVNPDAKPPGAVLCKINNTGIYDNCTTQQRHDIPNNLNEGKNELFVKARDRVGEESPEIKYEWFLDKTKPTVNISNTNDTAYTNDTFELLFGSFDKSADGSKRGSGLKSYNCAVRNAANAIVKGPDVCGGASESGSHVFDLADLSEGTYTVSVEAVDMVDRVSDPKSRTVVVDKTAPDTTLMTTGIATTTRDLTASFDFTGTDNQPSSPVSFECWLEGTTPPTTWSTCTPPSTQIVTKDGAYTFRVRAKDKAGNVDDSPPFFTWTVDTSKPTLIELSPAVTVIHTRMSDITFRYNATDTPSSNNLIFICSLNGSQELCNSREKTYTQLVEGPNTIIITVRDPAGNEDSETYTIHVDRIEPNTNLLGVQPNPSNNRNPTFSFSGNDTVTAVAELRYECSLDSLAWVPCSSNLAPFPPVTDGTHTFQVRAIDKVGNFDTTPPRFTWRVDLSEPETTILQKPELFTPSTSATFTFNGTDPITGTGVTGYECQFDGGGWNPCTSPRTLNSLVNGQHTFNVRARDRAGNTDGTPATHIWTVDTIAPPTPSITSPVSGTLLNTLNAVFTGADNGTGPTRFDCSITVDGQPDSWTTCTSPFQPTGLAEGTYWLKVRMVDQAGNTSAPAVRRFTLDSTPPDTTVTANIGAPVRFPTFTKETTATFSFSATKSRANENQTFTCKLDNNASVTPCASPQVLAGPFSPGRHTFTVYATDDAGNSDASSPAVFTWTVDTKIPTTVLIPQTQPQYRTSAQPTINFRGDDEEEAPGVPGSGVVAFDCEFDGQTISPCAPADPSGNASFTPGAPLADGPHELKLFAIDAVGHKASSPTVYTWTQDTVVPDTINLVRTPPDAVTTTQVFTFTFEASGTEAIPPTLECKLDDGEWAACTSPLVTPPLDNGPHTFQVRAKDVAGNVDESPLTDTWVVDRAGPVVTLTGRPNAATNLAVATFTFSADDNGGSGFASAECRIDSGAWEACSTLSASYSDLAEGDHTFHVRATDRLGNVGAAITYSWTVDRTAPDTAMTGDLPAVITVQSITLHFTGTDALTAEGLKFECSLDNGPFESCVSPRTFPGLTNGVHNLRVRAIDGAGNIDQTPATHEWRVEVANPIQQIHLPLVRK